jgi:hypothetical protein
MTDHAPPPPRLQQSIVIVCGIAIVTTGIIALRVLDAGERFSMLHGCLTLGGALLIAGLFSLRMPAHGIIGAGVVALLGAARGLANLPDLAHFWLGEQTRGIAPLIEFAVTIICLIVVTHTLRWLLRERIRRMLDS